MHSSFSFIAFFISFFFSFLSLIKATIKASVVVSSRSSLCVQEIVIKTKHKNQIQTITVNNINEINNKNGNSTFILYIDLSTYGYGIQSTAPIYFNSVAMRENEIFGSNNKIPLGEMIGESLQNKIESISAFIFFKITGSYLFYSFISNL